MLSYIKNSQEIGRKPMQHTDTNVRISFLKIWHLHERYNNCLQVFLSESPQVNEMWKIYIEV